MKEKKQRRRNQLTRKRRDVQYIHCLPSREKIIPQVKTFRDPKPLGRGKILIKITSMKRGMQ